MATNDTRFITEGSVQTLTPLTNIDTLLWSHQIKVVQDIYLKPLIGITLYRTIDTGIDAVSQTPANQSLLDDYITPFLAWHIYANALPDLFSTVVAGGISKRPGAQGNETITQQELDKKIANARDIAKSYADNMLEHLRLSTDHPEFKTSEVGEDRTTATNFAGIVFGGRRRNPKNWDAVNQRYID